MIATVKRQSGYGEGSVAEYPKLNFNKNMLDLCGDVIEVKKDPGRPRMWYGAGWYWHSSWLSFKTKSAHTANNKRKGKIARKKKSSKRATSPAPASKLKGHR